MGCGCAGDRFRPLNRPAIPARNIIRAVNTSQRVAPQLAALPPLPVAPPENSGTMSQDRRVREKLRRDAVFNNTGRG